VTSGTYERFFEQDGVRYHHILDTRTGYPVQNGLTSVTIITTASIEADALSTALFALGLEEGYRLAESLAGVEAIFVTEDNEVSITSGVSEIFELTNDDYEIQRP
jgi:thiamine biosynthesis lipoprotein